MPRLITRHRYHRAIVIALLIGLALGLFLGRVGG